MIGRHVRLAVILRVSGWTGVYYLDDDTSVDLVIGRRAIDADVVDAIAGAALYCCWGAVRAGVIGGWRLATICCAERGFQLDEHRIWIYCLAAKRNDASSAMRNRPDASVVMKVHIRLATGT